LVNLERICTDNLGLQILRDADCQIGFTDRRRAGQYQVPQISHEMQKTRVLLENAGQVSCEGFDQIRLPAPCPEFWRRLRPACGRETLYREVPEQRVELPRWLSSERRQSLWTVVYTYDRRLQHS